MKPLLEKSKYCRLLMLPIHEGKAPVNMLSERLKNVKEFNLSSDCGNSPVKRFSLKSILPKCGQYPISKGIDPEKWFLCIKSSFKLCKADIPFGTNPERALLERSKERSRCKDQIRDSKSGLPEKWLLEMLRPFKAEHLERVLGRVPSSKFPDKERNRSEKQVSKRLSGSEPESEFSERSRNLMELKFTRVLGTGPERLFRLRFRVCRFGGRATFSGVSWPVKLLFDRESTLRC